MEAPLPEQSTCNLELVLALRAGHVKRNVPLQRGRTFAQLQEDVDASACNSGNRYPRRHLMSDYIRHCTDVTVGIVALIRVELAP